VEENGKPANVTQAARPPLGMFPAKVDDKGRMKLPTVFAQYFNNADDGKLFITSLDGRIGRIYSIAAWRDNEVLFDQYREDPEALQNLLFNAQDLGAEAKIDEQGRVTLNTELRKELKLTAGQELHLYAYKNCVEFLTDELYQERRRRARPNADLNVKKLEMAGMK
jgi:MraZ protein